MKILIINSGSSSLKYQMLDMKNNSVLCSGLVERIGEAMGNVSYKKFPDSPQEEKSSFEQPISDHSTGMRIVVDLITDLCRSEERRVGKECRSRWSPYH